MTLSTLFFMRHAKSSWAYGDLTDHERPLNERGRKAAKTVGDLLRARGEVPDLIWSSNSARTTETVARAFGENDRPQILFFETLYHANANAVLLFAEQKGEPDMQSLMLVGHNPGIEGLIYYFGDIPRRAPTGTCAIFTRTDPDTHWLLPEAWTLKSYILPRDLETK